MPDNNKLVDIIVTHYDEPWEVCRPFFNMLQYQCVADMNKVNIILVQDGTETALDWNACLGQYDYTVKVITTRHVGTAGARNLGMRYAQSDWIMFCDVDDMFADVCAVSMLTSLLPTDSCDIIWSKYVMEMIWRRGLPYLQTVTVQNFLNTTCKLYRRSFLEEHNIQFDTRLPYTYEYAFNAICLTEAPPFKIRTWTTDFYPYMKKYRKNSLRSSEKYYIESGKHLFYANIFIADELMKRGHQQQASQFYTKALCFAYYSIHDPVSGNNQCVSDEDAHALFREHADQINSVQDSDLEVLMDETQTMMMNYIQRLFNEHKREYYFKNDTVTFGAWLGNLIDSTDNHQHGIDTVQIPCNISVVDVGNTQVNSHQDTQPTPPKTDSHVVVYCGTANVYEDMIASCKSLLCNTPVDKVYFLIEDDVFPYQLPDIVETINVSDQTVFPHDGPNFDTAWTYMCMMRACFPQMFSQYDRILSLDIDIIVADDVSDLWDYDLSDYYLAGVPESQRQQTPDDPIYINFGVVMMNLKKLREDNIAESVIENLNRNKVDCPEQTAYNEACAHNILALSPEFNSTVYSHITGKADKERILHYAGQTFWKHYALVKQYSDLDWVEVMSRQKALKEGE